MTPTALQLRVDTVRQIGMYPVTEADREQMAVALVIQGYDLMRAHELAFGELGPNDGALQMLARHRLHAAPPLQSPATGEG